jgi:hypothetical protein
MKTLLALAFTTLAGCSSMPSLEYCSDVSYVRSGSIITINAKCNAPIATPGLPRLP